MYGDGARRVQRHILPHPAVDLVGREHRSGVAHEKAQDVVLLRRQRHRVAVHGDGLGVVVQADTADDQRASLHLSAAQLQIPPQLGAHPRQQLHRVEGLGDIVIRAHVESQHLVGVLALGGQQDHRHVAGLAQLRHGGQAVHDGHHDVHEDQMHVLPGGDAERLLAVIGGQHPIALRAEIDLQRGHDVLFVVNHQNVVHGKFLSDYCTRYASL